MRGPQREASPNKFTLILPALRIRYMWPGGEQRVYNCRTWPKNGKDEKVDTLQVGRSKGKMPLISISHTFNTFLFRRLSPDQHCAAALLFAGIKRMQFEVLATCHTTRARVSRMKLARKFFNKCIMSTTETFQLPQME